MKLLNKSLPWFEVHLHWKVAFVTNATRGRVLSDGFAPCGRSILYLGLKKYQLFYVDSSTTKVIFHHIPIFQKKRCHSFIKQASFLGLEIPSPNTKPPQNPTPQVLHQGVDCVKQLCEKYLSLAVEEEALALNSFKILVLIGLFFSKRNWSEFPTDGLSGKLAILSLEWNDLKIHLRNIRSKFGEKKQRWKTLRKMWKLS